MNSDGLRNYCGAQRQTSPARHTCISHRPLNEIEYLADDRLKPCFCVVEAETDSYRVRDQSDEKNRGKIRAKLRLLRVRVHSGTIERVPYFSF